MSPINIGTSFSSEHKISDGSWLWKDDDAMGLPLLTMTLAHFGPEVLSWAPATIAMEIKSEFGVDCHPIAFDRLMAAIQVYTSNAFYVSLPDFCKLCLCFAGEPNDYFPDAGDCAWGVTEAMLISPPDSDQPFTDEIRAYIGEVLNQEGILNPPDVLRIALRDKGDLLAQLNYDFADDPEMFQMIANTEADRAKNINTMVKLRTEKMLKQLANLPLPSQFKSNASKVANKLLQKLAAK